MLLDSRATELLSCESDVSLAMFSKERIEKLSSWGENLANWQRKTEVLERKTLDAVCLWSQLLPARAPSSEWGSWEADAEVGFDTLAIFRNQWLWIVPCGEGIMLPCERGVFALFSMKGRMLALNRGVWATFVGSKIADASGVQELGWTFSQVIPIPSDKVPLSQPGPDLL